MREKTHWRFNQNLTEERRIPCTSCNNVTRHVVVASADGTTDVEDRIMGNVAAHEVKPHKENELNTAFDVVEHLLVGVYLLPAKAAILPEKKAPSGGGGV
jgi:hypothetical protein